MAIDLKIPQVGESITEVQISDWLKSEGDTVQKDEPVAVIDSEKTTFDLPSPASGTLKKILHQAGETVSVGEVIAQIESNGAPAQKKAKKPERTPGAQSALETTAESKPEAKPKVAGKAGQAEEPNEAPKMTTEPDKPATAQPLQAEGWDSPDRVGARPMQPATQKPKKEREPEGDETAEPSAPQPERAKSKPSTDREEEIVPMTMLRRTVARRLVEAKQQMAMLTTFGEVDMSAVQALRKEHQEAFEKRYQVRLGLMSFFVKAAIDALKQFPQLNAEVRDTDIVYRNYFDIGVAIASERGLVVPVLRRAERLSFAELEKAIGDFSRRAQEGQLKPEELEGGTFTITNGGVFGSLLSTPIINPPQSGILGMHTIQDRPVAVQGQVTIRPMMYLALTYDHRIVDGREAVLFLRRVKEAIETPARMLIEI